MDKLEDVRRREREHLQMMEEQREKAYQAYRLHHLLSTKQVCPEKNNMSRNEIIIIIIINCFTALSTSACTFPFNV